MSVTAFDCLLFSASANVRLVQDLLAARIPSALQVSAPDSYQYLTFFTHHNQLPLMLRLTSFVQIEPDHAFFSSFAFQTQELPNDIASIENFYIIDYKWNNKSQHHFIGSGVKITCLYLHIMLQFISLCECLLVSTPLSYIQDLQIIYRSWIPGCLSLDH